MMRTVCSLLFSLVVISNCTPGVVATAALGYSSADVGPISLFPSKGRLQFEWCASLKSETGKGTSRETSTSTWKRNYATNRESIQSISRVSKKLIELYPHWLVKGGVTFGFLRAVVVPSSLKTSSTTIIKPRFLDLNLLSFGVIQVKRCNKRRGCEFELPVTGGLLALNDRGCLRFWAAVPPNHHARDDDEQNRISCGFRSEIGGNFCPWIAGPAPVAPTRKWVYLSTQSIVHAFVMWRFHQTWNARVRNIC